MGIELGKYHYTEKLLALDRQRPLTTVITWPSHPTCLVTTHAVAPRSKFAAYVHDGLLHGFHIGFNRQSALKPNRRNNPSSLGNSSVVSSHISVEVDRGRRIGPLPPPQANLVHVSPVGLVPKPHFDKFRMIVDLSFPTGASINDGNCKDLCSLQYTLADHAVEIILQLGQGAQLVKMDLKDAYRLIPVHPHDQRLLAISWQDQFYVDCNLPFGLRSAPKLFIAFADMVAWAIYCHGVCYVLHYLDDFLLLGAPDSAEATMASSMATELFSSTGISVAEHKTEGPTTSLTFLGILIDTSLFQLRLPPEKMI